MPELPEVTTTVLGLRKTVIGKTIATIWSDPPRLVRSHGIDAFAKQLTGRKIIGVIRRGKNILIDLSGGAVLHVHMKMTGHLLFGKWKKTTTEAHPLQAKQRTVLWTATGPGAMRDDPFNRHIRFVMTFSDTTQLALCDMRRFAKMNVFATREAAEHEFSILGPEPLVVSEKVFVDRVTKKTTRSIKQVLLDQTVLAGIGNIYSDEMLFRAGIHPLSSGVKIPDNSLRKLYRAMRTVLNAGINFGGDSMSDYRNVDGERGKFQEKHLAYRRTGKPCKKRGCIGTITRHVIAARSAHFCPQHQVLYT